MESTDFSDDWKPLQTASQQPTRAVAALGGGMDTMLTEGK